MEGTASHPDAVSRLAQSSFTIVGLELGYKNYKATVSQNSTYNFDVPVTNSGQTPVTGLAV